jgi:hypothetical protein
MFRAKTHLGFIKRNGGESIGSNVGGDKVKPDISRRYNCFMMPKSQS